MGKLPVLSGLQLVRALAKVGYAHHRTKGSHAILIRDHPARSMVTVPLHDELRKGTLRTILRQTGVSVDQLGSML